MRASREMIEQQFDAMDDGTRRLGLAEILKDNLHHFSLTPWVNHGVHDEEGVPTEFTDPVLTISVASYFDGMSIPWKSRTFPASAVPILAEAVRAETKKAVTESVADITKEIDRFMAVVTRLQTQRSRIQNLFTGDQK